MKYIIYIPLLYYLGLLYISLANTNIYKPIKNARQNTTSSDSTMLQHLRQTSVFLKPEVIVS